MLLSKTIFKQLLPGLLVFFFTCMIYGQTIDTTQSQSLQTTEAESLEPAAVPVLTPGKAKNANDKAIFSYLIRNQIPRMLIKVVKHSTICLLCLFVVLYFIRLYRMKRIKSTLLKVYRSPFGRMFYCTRFYQYDWIAIILIFFSVFFFSILAGQKAMLNGYIGEWYASQAANAAISLYNTGRLFYPTYEPESKLDNFINKGSKGDLEYSSISNEDAKPQQYTKTVNFYYANSGIPRMMAYWWKIIGNPDWSTLYIVFSLMYGLTCVAAYLAIRQVTGLVPSFVLGLSIFFYPTIMHYSLFTFRDGLRALFCYIAIAVLLYLLKGAFNWKGIMICGAFLFAICSFSKWFRNDFVVLIPFIIIATLFFHGKLRNGLLKKIVIIVCIISGYIVASAISTKINYYGRGHVLYIGLAEHPYLDNLQYSTKNYTWGISYSDNFGYILGSAKQYHDNKVTNTMPYSLEYDKQMKKEIHALFRVFPYDFLRLALSSFIQDLTLGHRFAGNEPKYIRSAPGNQITKKLSNFIFQDCSQRFFGVIYLLTFLLFLGGGFYKNILLCFAFMSLGGCYFFQFDVRHYFYLILLSVLSAGFVANRIIRIFVLITCKWKCIKGIFCKKKNHFFTHCIVSLVLFIIAFGILGCARSLQALQINKEISSFNMAETKGIDFKTNPVPSKVAKNKSATQILIPEFIADYLSHEDSKQSCFSEFFKIKFNAIGLDKPEKVVIFATYENSNEIQSFHPSLSVTSIIERTKTCPIPLVFQTECSKNVIYLPAYIRRSSSPLIGFEIIAGDKPIEITSVEQIKDSKKIHTQSAFLIPDQLEDFSSFGAIAWKKVLFAD